MPLSDTERLSINRRRLLALAGTTAAVPLVSAPAQATLPEPRLDAERISVAALQTRAVPGDVKANLVDMLAAIDRVQDQAGPKHLISFSGQALQGRVHGGAADLAAAAVDVDGPEMGALGAKAREVRAHITLSAWVRDAAWRGQVIAMSLLFAPDGRLRAKDWAPFQGATAAPDAGRFAATIESEFDRYVERYSSAAVLPVHATAVGRIALSATVATPEVFRAYALKGAEVFVRTAPLGAPMWDLQATSAYSRCFTVMTTSALDPEAAVAPGRGGTAIIGPIGEVMAEAGSKWEQAVTASLPIAHLRATRRPLEIPTAMVLPVYQRASRDLA